MTATYQELPVTDNIHLWNEFTAFNCRRIARVNWKSTLIFLLSCSGLFFQPTNDLIVSLSLSVLLWGGKVIGNKPQFSYQIRVSFNEIHLFFRWLWGQFVYSSSHLLPLLWWFTLAEDISHLIIISTWSVVVRVLLQSSNLYKFALPRKLLHFHSASLLFCSDCW